MQLQFPIKGRSCHLQGLGSLRDIIVHHFEYMSRCLTFNLFKRQDFSGLLKSVYDKCWVSVAHIV